MKNYTYGYLFIGIRKSEPSIAYFFKEVLYQHNPTAEELDKDLNDYVFKEGTAYNDENCTRINDFIGVTEILKVDDDD